MQAVHAALGPELVKACTDHSWCKQGREEVGHVVGPPEYAATRKGRLRQEKPQDTAVSTT